MKLIKFVLLLMALSALTAIRATAILPASTCVGDYVWHDANMNGIQDSGEYGIGGVVVNLYTSSGNYVNTATTDSNGYYALTTTPGSYYLQFLLPAGYGFTKQYATSDDTVDSDVDPTTGKTLAFTVLSDQTNANLDAGVYAFAGTTGVGNCVWNDLNMNGMQDAGEPGIYGVTIRLLTESGEFVASTISNKFGRFYFYVPAGVYCLEFCLPEGAVFSAPYQGTNTAADSDADPMTGKTVCFTINPGKYDPTRDAGIYYRACIGDTVWKDLDADGIRESGEYGLPGATVNLLACDGTQLNTTVTDGAGHYTFYVSAGSYLLQFIPPDGYRYCPQHKGSDDAVDSDADPLTGKTCEITVNYGESYLTCDAGMYKQICVGNYVWNDKNFNGIQDSSEVGVSGLTVKLLNAKGATVTTTRTNKYGRYLLYADPGTYCVQVIVPYGYAFITPGRGIDPAKDSDINPATGKTALLTMHSGQTNYMQDAGLLVPLPANAICDISTNFKDDVIRAGRYLWFNNSISVSNTGNACVTIRCTKARITFTANGKCYDLPVPDAMVTLSPKVCIATTTFDTATNTWKTIAPLSHADDVFLAGLVFRVPENLPGKLRNVCWEGCFSTDTPGTILGWRWGAAVYSLLDTDYTNLYVKPINGKWWLTAPSDHAGTPELFKWFLVPGALSNGKKNYTGSKCECAPFVPYVLPQA